MFIVKINKSVLLTYLGIIFAVVAMYFSFTKIAFAEIDYLRYSLVFLMLAGICDMFDGKVARMCKRTKEEKEFGIQIDSLADTVNFLCLPVVIMLSLGMNSVLNLIIYCIFILCGVSRLGYFNVHASLDSPVKFYNGLPVTSTSIVYPVIGLLHGKIPDCAFCTILLIVTALVALLFVFRIKIPKFKGIAYIIIPILAAVLAVLLLVIR